MKVSSFLFLPAALFMLVSLAGKPQTETFRALSDSACISATPHQMRFGLRGNATTQALKLTSRHKWRAYSEKPWVLINGGEKWKGSGTSSLNVTLNQALIPGGTPWHGCGTVVSAHIYFEDEVCGKGIQGSVEVFFYTCPCC